MRTPALICVVCAWAVAIPVASADMANATPQRELVLKLGPGELTPDFAEVIGKYGQRAIHIADKVETIGGIVSARCGEMQLNFIRAVQVANQNDNLRYNTQLEVGDALQVPPCPPLTGYMLTPRKVTKGDSAWKFFQDFSSTKQFAGKDIAFTSPLTLTGVTSSNPELRKIRDLVAAHNFPQTFPTGLPAAANPPMGTWRGDGNANYSFGSIPLNPRIFASNDTNFVEVFQAANPGLSSADTLQRDRLVVVPEKQETEYILPLAADAPDSIADLVAGQPGLTNALGRQVNAIDLSQGFEFFSSVHNVACIPTSLQYDEAYQNRLLRVLIENISLTGDRGLERPSMVILDSGVYDIAKIPGAPRPTSIVQPFSGSPSEFSPLDGLKDATHGSSVLMLAVGGLSLAQTSHTINYGIDVQPINIFTKEVQHVFRDKKPVLDAAGNIATGDFYSLDTERIIDAISFSDGAIINMSFGRDRQINELLSNLGAASRTLYVVAAGNAGKPLDSLKLYPGRNGGPHVANLLTVASVDGNDKLSSFSNRGEDFVDIAAPGCQVPTLSYDLAQKGFVTTTMTGTSFSAPQVSWVASMIRAIVGRKTAAFIKSRILVGADVHPDLTTDISEGRVLNPLKALSLSKDVVEVLDPSGSRQILRGILPTTVNASLFCDPAAEMVATHLAKVVRQFNGATRDPSENRLYFIDDNGIVRAKNCKAKDFRIDLKIDDMSESRSILAKDIVDITFRWPEAR